MANGHGGRREGAGRRPGAVSEAKKEIASSAKEHAEAALSVLVEVSADTQAPHSARVSAANAILDRAYGKPIQTNENHNTHDVEDPVKELFEAVANGSRRIGV